MENKPSARSAGLPPHQGPHSAPLRSPHWIQFPNQVHSYPKDDAPIARLERDTTDRWSVEHLSHIIKIH